MAGTATVITHESPSPVVGRIIADLIGDIATGAWPTLALPEFEGRILTITTDPGPASTDITLTTSAASDDIIDTTAPHGFVAGQAVRFKSLTGGSGLSANTIYYVSATSLGAQTFRVSAAASPDTPLDFTTDITAGTVTASMTDSPTDNYDLVLNNPDGFDALGAAGANRDTTTTERAAVTNGYVSRRETMTLVGTNNSVSMGKTRITLHYTQDV